MSHAQSRHYASQTVQTERCPLFISLPRNSEVIVDATVLHLIQRGICECALNEIMLRVKSSLEQILVRLRILSYMMKYNPMHENRETLM